MTTVEDEVLDIIRKKAGIRCLESWREFFELGALAGASGCLADVPEIKDPTEQVKYLLNRFRNAEPYFLSIPIAWLKHCLEEKLLSEKEVISLETLEYARNIGGLPLVVKLCCLCGIKA